MLPKKQELRLSIFFIVLGLLIFIISFTVKKRTVLTIGPGFMPRIIGGLITLLGAIHFFQHTVRKKVAPARVPKEKPIYEPSSANSESALSISKGKHLVLFSIVLMFLYVGFIEMIGFPIMTVIYLTIQFYVLSSHRGIKTIMLYLIVSLISSGIITFIFNELLGLFLPMGILG